jgi:hypothetical protein
MGYPAGVIAGPRRRYGGRRRRLTIRPRPRRADDDGDVVLGADGPSAFDWLTFAIAGGGLFAALGAIGWQWWTWTHAGPRIRVESVWALGLWNDGSSKRYVNLSVRNDGRAAAFISSWTFALDDDTTLWLPQPGLIGPTLPHRLEPHDGCSFGVALQVMQKVVVQQNVTELTMRPLVVLTNGQRVMGKPLKIALGGDE